MKLKAIVVSLLILPVVGLADPFYYPYYFLNGTITGYAGPAGYVNIPSTINSMTVTSIGDSAFFGCTTISSVTIPNSVTNIGEGAFYGCTSMNGVTIGSGVTTIGLEPFEDCTSMFLVSVDAANTNFCSVNNVLFNKSQTTLVEYPGGISGSYSIPNSVTNIGDESFNLCTKLTGVTISNGVTSIGSSAFGYCANLLNITIPNSVSSIGADAFQSSGVTNITIGTGLNSIGIYAFSDSTNLISFIIPSSVTSIGYGAFSGCTSLTSVTIPNSVTSIFQEAFYGCTSLHNITIPAGVGNVSSIGYEAFYGCTNLSGVYFKGNAPVADPINDPTVFSGDTNAIIYYLPKTTGWGLTNYGLPTKLWNPQVQTKSATFGVRTNQFGFTIAGTSNLVIVVEACTNLANPVWSPVATNTLNVFVGTNGTSYFSDAQWGNYMGRYYRLRSP